MFRDAISMSQVGLTHEQQFEILRIKFDRYYRLVEDREIENAIRNAMSYNEGKQETQNRLPKANEELRQTAFKNSPFHNVAALKKASKVMAPELLSSGAVLDRFFRSDELVCMARSKNMAETMRRENFRGGEEQFPYIVPNAMVSVWGLNSLGIRSKRCNNNVGPVTRVVIEFDSGTLDEQAALIGAISKCGVPLSMVLWSGGKSLHSWFDMTSMNKDERQKLFRYAAALGADRATFIPCQLCRTPNAIRPENGNRQEVYLLNVGT
jgi:hypothetical protein